MERAYLDTHPWITFEFSLADAVSRLTWAHLGECYSKCGHLQGVPLKPDRADHLATIYMRRGALASVAIEGNTLDQETVDALLDNSRRLPESQQYLEREVRNVLEALVDIRTSAATGTPFRLSPTWVKNMHAKVMHGLDGADHIAAGEYREAAVVVGSYRCAPAEDIEFLVDRLCGWINRMLEEAEKDALDENRYYLRFFAAVLAHLYVAWIHPFGDGNGRTARLVESAILAHGEGTPWVSASLLSDHYNRTRSRYYEKLELASNKRDVQGFMAYSAEGFRDQLRLQVKEVQGEQRKVAWINLVHEAFSQEPSTDTARRRRLVALNLPEDRAVGRQEVRLLTPHIAAAYSRASDRLLRRDLGKLLDLQLALEGPKGQFRSAIAQIDAFMPSSRNAALAASAEYWVTPEAPPST